MAPIPELIEIVDRFNRGELTTQGGIIALAELVGDLKTENNCLYATVAHLTDQPESTVRSILAAEIARARSNAND